MREETKNEKLILAAAEEEFMLKGYGGTKTTSIARKAGVTHAMLHYYYRTKENLFQKIFQQKVYLIASSFEMILNEDTPFETTIRSLVEKHFDFVMSNPGLINFVLNEIRANKENVELIHDIFRSKTTIIAARCAKLIEQEASKGAIKNVNPFELLATVASLNLSTSMFFMASDSILNKKIDYREELLSRKKEENVQYILFTIRV